MCGHNRVHLQLGIQPVIVRLCFWKFSIHCGGSGHVMLMFTCSKRPRKRLYLHVYAFITFIAMVWNFRITAYNLMFAFISSYSCVRIIHGFDLFYAQECCRVWSSDWDSVCLQEPYIDAGILQLNCPDECFAILFNNLLLHGKHTIYKITALFVDSNCSRSPSSLTNLLVDSGRKCRNSCSKGYFTQSFM